MATLPTTPPSQPIAGTAPDPMPVRSPAHPSAQKARRRTPGRRRTVLADGSIVFSTPISQYDPVLSADDYAVLARLRDQVREHIARTPQTVTPQAA